MIEKNPFYQTALAEATKLTDDTIALMAVIGLLVLLIALTTRRTRRRWRFKQRSGARILPFRNPRSGTALPDDRKIHLAESQMSAIAAASFETKPILNRSEALLLPVIEAAIAEFGRGHRVMAQTSLGELLRPSAAPDLATKNAAFAAINSKRLDFCIVDAAGRLVAAIEYQGSGHYSATAFMRDAVKREACRKAGVAFIEVQSGTRYSDLTGQLRRIIAAPGPQAVARHAP